MREILSSRSKSKSRSHNDAPSLLSFTLKMINKSKQKSDQSYCYDRVALCARFNELLAFSDWNDEKKKKVFQTNHNTHINIQQCKNEIFQKLSSCAQVFENRKNEKYRDKAKDGGNLDHDNDERLLEMEVL